MMIGNNDDPEYIAIRDEFVESLHARRVELEGWGARLSQKVTGSGRGEALEGIRLIAHKLAGVAGSYGFDLLTQAGGALDDLLCHETADADPQLVAQFATLLAEMLRETENSKRDPLGFRGDPRFAKLISCAESLDS